MRVRTGKTLGRRLLAVLATAVMATSMAVALPAAPASANTFGGCYGDGHEGCVPETFTYRYCFSGGGWSVALLTTVSQAVLYLNNNTNYTTVSGPCNTSTDVVFVLDTGLAAQGEYDCTDRRVITSTGQRFCRQARIVLNPQRMVDPRHTACHEIGHSVGLRHGVPGVDDPLYDDCMRSGENLTNPTGYNAHHRQHINARA